MRKARAVFGRLGQPDTAMVIIAQQLLIACRIVLAHIKGLRTAEMAIPTIYAGEVSHLKPVQYGLRVLGVVRAYRRGEYHRL